MKEVIISALHYRTPSQKGGLRTWHMANALSEQCNTTVVTFAVDTLSGERYPGPLFKLWHKQVLKDGALTIYRVNSFPCWRGNLIGRLLYYSSASISQGICLLIIGVRNKTVIISTHPLSLFAITYCISKLYGSKTICDIRDLPFDVAKEISYGLGKRSMSFLEKIETNCLKGSNAIICVSKGMIEKIKNKGVEGAKCKYVPIGYDNLGDEYLDPNDLKLPIKPRLRVCLTGTVGHLIDVGLLVEIAAKFGNDPRIDFFVAGDGQMLNHWKSVASQNDSNITFLGRIPKNQVSQLCENSDICLYPLIAGEATATMQGNKVFDYMGAGKPIIYTGSAGDVRTLIEKEKLGYCFSASDVDGVTGLLKRILQGELNRQLEEMGAHSKDLANSVYNSKVIMNDFVSDLDKIV